MKILKYLRQLQSFYYEIKSQVADLHRIFILHPLASKPNCSPNGKEKFPLTLCGQQQVVGLACGYTS